MKLIDTAYTVMYNQTEQGGDSAALSKKGKERNNISDMLRKNYRVSFISQREKENNIPYMELAEEEKEFHHWNDREGDEDNFLIKAELLRNFIYELESIHYENKYSPLEADNGDGLWKGGRVCLPDDFIYLEEDRRLFREDPQAYEWSFMIFNSY